MVIAVETASKRVSAHCATNSLPHLTGPLNPNPRLFQVFFVEEKPPFPPYTREGALATRSGFERPSVEHLLQVLDGGLATKPDRFSQRKLLKEHPQPAGRDETARLGSLDEQRFMGFVNRVGDEQPLVESLLFNKAFIDVGHHAHTRRVDEDV